MARHDMKKQFFSLLTAGTLILSGCSMSDFVTETGWVDSDITGVVTADTQVRLQDDFAAAVNQPLYVEGDLDNERIIERISRRVTERKRALIEDTSVTGEGLEELRQLVVLADDWEGRAADGVEPLRAYIAEIDRLEDAEAVFTWIADPQRNPLGISPIAVYGGIPSSVHLDSYVCVIANPQFSLKRAGEEYHQVNQTVFQEYRRLEDITSYLMGRMGYSEADAARILARHFQLEKQMNAAVDERDVEEEETLCSLEELEELAGDYPLEDYLEAWGYADARYFEADMRYIRKVARLCKRSPELVKAYLMVQYMIAFGPWLDQESVETMEQFSIPRDVDPMPEKRTPEQINEDRLFDGLIANTALQGILDAAYVQTYMEESFVNRLYGMTEEIIDTFRELFPQEEWMTEEGRQACLDKLNAMRIHVIYPDIDDMDCSELEIRTAAEGGSFAEAMAEARRFDRYKEAQLSDRDYDRGYWNPYDYSLSTTVTNACYNPMTNGIYIFAGILEDPVYAPEMTDEEMLSGIGVIVGHEITHAFDESGVRYDKDGLENEWMPEVDRTAFVDKCLVVSNYYSTLETYPGSGFYTGANVVGEATADMGGMRAVLHMARKRADFDYDAFFRHYAGVWAAQVDQDVEAYYFRADVHPLNYLRINVVVAQFDEFCETYDVQPGDGMYVEPSKRIAVW